jgi:hypothetical protein
MKITHRQFYDIQSMAERIQKNRHAEGDLENFVQFSKDLKKYLLKTTDNEMIHQRLERLPMISYGEFQPSLMQYLRLNGISQMWNKRKERKEILEKVSEIAATYSSIHFLMKQEME